MKRIAPGPRPALSSPVRPRRSSSAVLWVRPTGAGATGGELVAQPVFGSPAGRFLGASPQEAPGEVWALARGRAKIVRYTDSTGWETMPGPFGPGEQPIGELEFAPGALAGRSTPAGGVAILAQTESEQMLIVRDPGGRLHAAPQPGTQLHSEESLFSSEGSTGVLDVPVEEPGGRTGAFVVPATEGGVTQEAVLGFDGAWEREPICVGFAAAARLHDRRPPPSTRWRSTPAAPKTPGYWQRGQYREKGSSSSRANPAAARAGKRSGASDALEGRWGRCSRRPTPSFAQPSPTAPLTVGITARTAGQPLTVTSKGVWVDARLSCRR